MTLSSRGRGPFRYFRSKPWITVSCRATRSLNRSSISSLLQTPGGTRCIISLLSCVSPMADGAFIRLFIRIYGLQVSNSSLYETARLLETAWSSHVGRGLGLRNQKRTATFMSYTMLPSAESSEAGTTCVYAICPTILSVGLRLHSIGSGYDFEWSRKGKRGVGGHSIHY